MADSSGDEAEAHAPPSTVELLLQQIMAKQEQMEERSTRRFVTMQATIDAQEAALAAATAALPGASIWAAPPPAAPAEGGWLRRIATSAITPTAAAPSTVPPAPRPAPSAATLAAVAALGRMPAPTALGRSAPVPTSTTATSAAAAATSIAAIAARARAARAARQPAAPEPIDVDADGERDEYFDALDEQYDLLTAAPPSRRARSKGRRAR